MNDIIVGVQEIERVREFVAVLMNDVCHTAAIDFGFVSSRTLWIKFRFSMVKVCVVVGYDLTEGGVMLKKGKGSGTSRIRLWI